jgi:hypothetical protein
MFSFERDFSFFLSPWFADWRRYWKSIVCCLAPSTADHGITELVRLEVFRLSRDQHLKINYFTTNWSKTLQWSHELLSSPSPEVGVAGFADDGFARGHEQCIRLKFWTSDREKFSPKFKICNVIQMKLSFFQMNRRLAVVQCLWRFSSCNMHGIFVAVNIGASLTVTLRQSSQNSIQYYIKRSVGSSSLVAVATVKVPSIMHS